jgi:hypothetical protein
MAEQASSIEQRAQLRRVLRALVSNAGGGKGLAGATRLKEPQISRCLADHYDDQLPVDVVLDAMILSGSPVLLAWLAGQIGYEIVEAGSRTGAGINHGHAMDLVRKAGDAAGSIVDALADGKITPTEDREMVNHLNAGMKAFQEALRALGEKP